MSLIRAFSDLSLFASGGGYEYTAANYPALKSHFKFLPTDVGKATFADSIAGGPVVATDTGITQDTNSPGLYVGLNALKAPNSGAWPVPGAKSVLMIVAGAPTATGSGVIVGSVNASGNGLKVSGNTSPVPQVNNGGTAISGTAQIVGSVAPNKNLVIADSFVWGDANGFVGYDLLENGVGGALTYTQRAAVSLATIASLPAIDALINIQAAMPIATLQLWYFTTLPSAAMIKAAVAWTHYNVFTLLRRDPYPGFKGMT